MRVSTKTVAGPEKSLRACTVVSHPCHERIVQRDSIQAPNGIIFAISELHLRDTTYDWHVAASNGQTIGDGTAAGFQFTPNAPGRYTVTLTATDDDGAQDSASVVIDAAWNDATPPTSSVSSLPGASGSTHFLVQWSGQDNPGGSGIATYNVYVQDNAGPFTLWQSSTAATSAFYPGAVGHSYGFYSLATDRAGNQEVKAAVAKPARLPRPARRSARPASTRSMARR